MRLKAGRRPIKKALTWCQSFYTYNY